MVELLISSSRSIAAGLCLLALFPASGSGEVRLAVMDSRGYENVAARVKAIPPERLERARQLTGAADLGIAVQIISESEARERQVPSWVSGYAVPEAGAVVLIPARAVTYPNDGIEDLIVHEAAHVLIDAAAGGGAVPRWFHEGVAMYATTGWRLEDATRLTFGMWSATPTSLPAIDRAFHSEYAAVSRAYGLSGAFVRRLVQQHGPGVIAEILGGVRQGSDFDSAFRQATGQSLIVAEQQFWRSRTLWSRWVPLLTSSLILWIGVTFLAVAAIGRRRRRDVQRLREWDAEEPP